MSTLAELIKLAPEDKVDDLLREVGEKNTVRVVKYAASRPNPKMRAVMKRVMDEMFPSRLHAPALIHLDEMRMLAGLPPRYLDEFFRVCGGDLRSVTANLRVDVGKDYVCDSLGNNGSRPAVAYYMALTENGTAPGASDTTLTAEITTGGLARATATYAHTTGATSYTLQKQFTASTSFSTVQKEGIFNASTAGTLFVENTFTSTALVSGDQLTVTHTINV